MEFVELICARKSIRKYEGGIDHDTLVRILEEAQRAPSWKNQQTARCYAVETPEILEDFRAAVLPSFNQNSSAKAALIVTTFVKDVVGFNGGGSCSAAPEGAERGHEVLLTAQVHPLSHSG